MSTQHTPGPWVAAELDGSGWVDIYPSGYVGLPTGSTRHENAEANARLIAAAPEMLVALMFLKNDDGKDIPPYAWKLVQAAIAKATGEDAI